MMLNEADDLVLLDILFIFTFNYFCVIPLFQKSHF
jgi:hypothetical protein